VRGVNLYDKAGSMWRSSCSASTSPRCPPVRPLLFLIVLLILLLDAPALSAGKKFKGKISAKMLMNGARQLPATQVAPEGSPPRVFYNRISKAGSTTMLGILDALQRRNGFAHYHAGSELYYARSGPGANEAKAVDFFTTTRGVPAIYDCHTFFVDFFGSQAIRARMGGDVSDVQLINVMRNPVQRYRSRFYYLVDPVSRNPQEAAVAQRKREADPCGCANTSFNDCISLAATNSSCNINADISRKASNLMYFLSYEDYTQYKKVSCRPAAAAHLVRKAMAHMEEYTVIGLTDRMHETMELLEERIPAVFLGAAKLFAKGAVGNHARKTQVPDHILAQGPLVSAETEAILRANPCNEGEFALWDHAKWLFHQATGVDVSGL